MHPRVTVGSVELVTWAFFVCGGVFLSWILLLARTRRLGYRTLPVLLWLVLAFPAGALFANLLAGVVLALTTPGAPWSWPALTGSGLTVLGSIVACGVFSVAYIRIVFHQAPWRLLDAAAFTFPLTTAFGRLGCLANGCCFGERAAAPHAIWTVRGDAYALSTPAAAYYRAWPGDTPVWNLPLFFVASALVTLVVTERVYRANLRHHGPHGVAFFVTLFMDQAARVAIEALRAPEPGSTVANPWRWLAAGMAVLALLGLLWRWRQTPQPA